MIFKLLFFLLISFSLGSSFTFEQYSNKLLESKGILSLKDQNIKSLESVLVDTSLSVGQRIKKSFNLLDGLEKNSIYLFPEYKDLFLWCLESCNKKDQLQVRPYLFKLVKFDLSVMDESAIVKYLISDKSLPKSYYRLAYRFHYLDKTQKKKLSSVILSKFKKDDIEILCILSYLGDIKSRRVLQKNFELEMNKFVEGDSFNEKSMETILFFSLLENGNFFSLINKYFHAKYFRKVGGEVCTINKKYAGKLSIQIGDSFRLKSPGEPAFLVSRSDYLNCVFDDEREKIFLAEILLKSARRAVKIKGLKTEMNLIVHVVKSRKGNNEHKQKELLKYLTSLNKKLPVQYTSRFIDKKHSYEIY